MPTPFPGQPAGPGTAASSAALGSTAAEREAALIAAAEGRLRVPIRLLHRALADPAPRVRAAAAFCLGKCGTRASWAHLQRAFCASARAERTLRRQLLVALCDLGSPATLQPLLAGAGSWSAAERQLVGDCLRADRRAVAQRALATLMAAADGQVGARHVAAPVPRPRPSNRRRSA